MEFTRIRISNFLTIGDSGDLFLSERGLNLLQGVNQDDTSTNSNGAGKSTIPDALCWVLFGVTAREESGDAVVNDKVKKDCMVQLDMTDGASLYTVTRFRKHAAHKNLLQLVVSDAAGATINLTKGTEKDTQAEIVKILGCTYDVFRSAIYAGQEDMPDLPKMTDKQLKVLIEEAAGVQRLENAYKIALKQESAVELRLTQVQKSKMDAIANAQAAKVKIETALIRSKEFEDGRQGRVDALLFQAEAIRVEAVTLVNAAKEVDEQSLQTRATSIDQALSEITAAQAKVTQFETLTLKPVEKAFNSAEFEYKFQLSVMQKHRTRYDNAQHELEKPCRECGKQHTEADLEQLKASVKKQLLEQAEVVTNAKTAMDAAKEALEKANVTLADLRSKVPDASALNAERIQVAEKIRAVARVKMEAGVKAKEVERLRNQAEQVKKEPNPQNALIESLKADMQKNVELARQLTTQIDAIVVEHEVAQGVTKVFSPAGVRAHILDTVTPFLNERTADYLSTLSDGNITAVWSTLSRTAKGELREKFNIEVANNKGGKSFRALSGGEKRKVRLACMLALQDLVASRATKPLGIWMGDEIDDALDPAGLERLMAILEKKAREKGTVLIISHNALSDWVDSVTTVTKSAGGISRVDGALAVA